MENKKHLIILILKIFESTTDKDHPITQTKIAYDISQVYSCDRKTVGRNIGYLIKVGYPIVKTTKGYYLDKKKFTIEEANFVLNAVLMSPEKSEEEKQDIAIRLKEVLNKIYR